MNIIEVPSNHEMFSKEFSGMLENFIYDEFGIIIRTKNKMDIGVVVFFEKGFDGTQFCLTVLNNKPINKEVYYDIYISEKNKDGMEVMCSTNEYKYLNIGHDLAHIILRIMLYIMNTPREKSTKPKLPNEETERKENHRKSTKENKVHLLDEIVEYVNENGLAINQNGTHKINCPCWSVRGHYRHYKSGKVIFVENYKKGKERENKEPKSKTYTV